MPSSGVKRIELRFDCIAVLSCINCFLGLKKHFPTLYNNSEGGSEQLLKQHQSSQRERRVLLEAM